MSINKKTYSENEKNHFFKSIINCLVLFASDKPYIESLIGPTFSPIFELETEFDYAFLPVVFENGIKYGKVNPKLESKILKFKEKVENIPSKSWEWEKIFVDKLWIELRIIANEILDDLGIVNKEFKSLRNK